MRSGTQGGRDPGLTQARANEKSVVITLTRASGVCGRGSARLSSRLTSVTAHTLIDLPVVVERTHQPGGEAAKHIDTSLS